MREGRQRAASAANAFKAAASWRGVAGDIKILLGNQNCSTFHDVDDDDVESMSERQPELRWQLDFCWLRSYFGATQKLLHWRFARFRIINISCDIQPVKFSFFLALYLFFPTYNSEYVTKKHRKRKEKSKTKVGDEFLAGFQWHIIASISSWEFARIFWLVRHFWENQIELTGIYLINIFNIPSSSNEVRVGCRFESEFISQLVFLLS